MILQKRQRLDCEALCSKDYADESNQSDERWVIVNGGRTEIDGAQARFGQNEIALRGAHHQPSYIIIGDRLQVNGL